MKNAIAHPVLTTKIAVGTGVVATIDGIRAVNNHTLAPVVNTTKAKLTERKYLKAARSVMKDQMLTIGASVVAAKEARDAEVKAAAAARAQAEKDAKFAAEMEADIAAHAEPATEDIFHVTEAEVAWVQTQSTTELELNGAFYSDED